MARADHRHHGAGVQGKGDGTGALTEVPEDLPDNMALSNRDKKQHSDERGLDGKRVRSEQRQDRDAGR
jgi:hypothetical protein